MHEKRRYTTRLLCDHGRSRGGGSFALQDGRNLLGLPADGVDLSSTDEANPGNVRRGDLNEDDLFGNDQEIAEKTFKLHEVHVGPRRSLRKWLKLTPVASAFHSNQPWMHGT
jgi:hypothetical protein